MDLIKSMVVVFFSLVAVIPNVFAAECTISPDGQYAECILVSDEDHVQVTLEWTKNSEYDIAGYKLYKRPFGSVDFGSPIILLDDAGTVLEYTVTVYSSVDTGTEIQTEFHQGVGHVEYAAKAYDTEGLESDFSDNKPELILRVKPAPPQNLRTENIFTP